MSLIFLAAAAWAAPLCAAGRDLPPGVALAPGDLITLDVPLDFTPEGVFSTCTELVGRVPFEPILGLELVRRERLTPPGTPPGPAVPPGLVATAVELRETTRWIAPGQLVDLVLLRAGRREACVGAQAVRVVEVVRPDGTRSVLPTRGDVAAVVVALTSETRATVLSLGDRGAWVPMVRNDIDLAHLPIVDCP